MINKISHCINRTITGSFQNIGEVVEFIKSPPTEHLDLVQYARTLERGSEEYAAIKISKLPAVTINFSFSNGYIIGKNVSTPTGYLYIDVDGMTEQDLELNKAYVCAYWRSLSDTGLSLVVKVDGLTPDNFKTATEEIAKLLDIPYDKRAVSIDRLTVLSYDPNAYYNDNVEVFPIAEMIPMQSVELVQDSLTVDTEKSTQYNTIIKTISIGYDYIGYKLRFNNLDELLQHYDIVFDENGLYDFGRDNKLKYSLIYVPFRKIIEGERENILKSIAYQLIALNKTASKDLILKYLYAINYGKMSPPLENSEIETTVAKIYQNLNDVEPIPNAERRFLYDNSKNLTLTDKRRLNIKQIHKDRTNKTQFELLKIMKNWDIDLYGKMTIKKLAKVAIKDPKTVQTYYTKLKTEILQDFDEEQVQMAVTKKDCFKSLSK
ncbi:VirE-like protein [Chryseobacterium sp. 7]|uniref:BT4734/BF3469 family protein n=1 Tax=Chryseobacterium sp. 7 TaxID=2035214 RepID=UPI000EAD3777|nr:BT4734/BF3469 family protein [Chryseobacterium sp. 7]RLJ33821.1 VirE-like protein [Chryseobacterium sp. 7]